MSTDSLKFESEISSTQAAEYLDTLAAGLRDGVVTMESGSESVTLRVADGVSFACSAKASPEKGKATVEVSVKWRTSSGQHAVGPDLLVLPGSQVDEHETYAKDFIDRNPLEDIAGRSGRRTLIGAGRNNRGELAGGGNGGTPIGTETATGEARRDATSVVTPPGDGRRRDLPSRAARPSNRTARGRRTAASKPRRATAPAASRGAAKAKASTRRRGR